MVTSVYRVSGEEAFAYLSPDPTPSHTHNHRFIAVDTLVPVSSWRAESCLSLCVPECVCVCLCVQSPSKACCSALLCWPGHVATLKLLSESPVKLLRSSTTLAVGSGNPFASCSLHTPLPASLPFPCLSCSPSHAYTYTLFLCVRSHLFSLSVCVCVLTVCLFFFLFSFSHSLFPSLCLFLVLTAVSA